MTQMTQAWKDPAYRATLDQSELDALNANPAGTIDIEDKSLGGIAGGTGGVTYLQASCYTCLTCGQSTCRTCFTCGGWPCG